MASRTTTPMDRYLAKLPADQRAVLQKLRQTIQSAAPKAEEGTSYGLPAFLLHGKPLVAFSASAKHLSFFPMNGHTVSAHRDALKNFEVSKGTIRFTADKPLPAALVRKLVKERAAENADRLAQPKPIKPKSAAAKAKTTAATRASDKKAGQEVTAFLRDLDHPLKKEIEAVRKTILGISPEIREGIKWNAPSFRTRDDFATFFLRPKHAVQLIFHRGAKKRDNSLSLEIPDPLGIIQWLATDRCLVNMGTGKEIKQRQEALEHIVREWLRQAAL